MLRDVSIAIEAGDRIALSARAAPASPRCWRHSGTPARAGRPGAAKPRPGRLAERVPQHLHGAPASALRPGTTCSISPGPGAAKSRRSGRWSRAWVWKKSCSTGRRVVRRPAAARRRVSRAASGRRTWCWGTSRYPRSTVTRPGRCWTPCIEHFDTVVLAMHDVELALRYASRIIGLKQGGIVLDRPSAGLTASDLDFSTRQR